MNEGKLKRRGSLLGLPPVLLITHASHQMPRFIHGPRREGSRGLLHRITDHMSRQER